VFSAARGTVRATPSFIVIDLRTMSKPTPASRDDYRHFLAMTTRWMDNDVYGHVNNVVYYSYFDTVVNEYLIRAGVLDVEQGETIGLVVETQCNYFSPLAFPDRVEAGLRVARIGTSSVRYEVGLFKEGSAQAAAQGHFVHVYVDRATRRPAVLPEALRAALAPLVLPRGGDEEHA
jgi:acyl-CoA thioester hydrolase